MELVNSVTGMPCAFHFAIVTIVFVGAVLLFVFGFQSTEKLAFNKVKADLKSVKKRKVKEKKSSNNVVNNSDSKSKGSTIPKSKATSSDDKTKKTNALKEKNTKKEQANNEKNKNKGKENANSLTDMKNELGGWVKTSRKNRKAQNNILPSNKESSGKGSNNVKNSKKEGKTKENTKKDSAPRTEKKPKDDEGEWQEAKSSKKRRKVFREDL